MLTPSSWSPLILWLWMFALTLCNRGVCNVLNFWGFSDILIKRLSACCSLLNNYVWDTLPKCLAKFIRSKMRYDVVNPVFRSPVWVGWSHLWYHNFLSPLFVCGIIRTLRFFGISLNTFNNLCLCETWLEISFKDEELFLHGYHLVRSKRDHGGHGGVLIGLRSSIYFEEITFPENMNVSGCETSFINLCVCNPPRN